MFVIIGSKNDLLECRKTDDDIWNNLKDELSGKNIIYEKISTKDESEKIEELFLKIAKKFLINDNKNKNLKTDDSSLSDENSSNINIRNNINENVENYTEFKYNGNKSGIDFDESESKKENNEEQFSDFESILLEEWRSDSDEYFDRDGFFIGSFEALGYQRKKEVYNEIMELLSEIINLIDNNRLVFFYSR